MIGFFVAVMLCHHVEGVCKPWSAAALAARAAAETAARVAAELAETARQAQLAARIARAQSIGAGRLERARRASESRSDRRSALVGRRRRVEALPAVVDGLVVSVKYETEAGR